MNIRAKTYEEEFLSIMRAFGDNVKARREMLGQGHDQVAKAVKISVARLMRIEAGTEKQINLTLIVTFAVYFKIDFKQIWGEFLPAAKKEPSSQRDK